MFWGDLVGAFQSLHFSLYISSCSVSISNCFSVSSLFHRRPTAIQSRHNHTAMMNVHFVSMREIKPTRVQFLDTNWEIHFIWCLLLNVPLTISVVLCSVVLWCCTTFQDGEKCQWWDIVPMFSDHLMDIRLCWCHDCPLIKETPAACQMTLLRETGVTIQTVKEMKHILLLVLVLSACNVSKVI